MMSRQVDACGKHAHATRRKAHLHRRQLRDYSLTVYPCPSGFGFHVGHRAGQVNKQERVTVRRFDWRAALSEEIEYEMALDPGIADAVQVLRGAGIATYESCEGGKRHAFVEPTVRFRGDHAEALRAVAACLDHALAVTELRRVWGVTHGELDGPWWEVIFSITGR